MILGEIISSSISSMKRKIKLYIYNDPRTASQYGPAGVDSGPLAGMKAIYAQTGRTSEPTIVGYLQKSIVAGGEIKMFSFDESNELAYVFCREDSRVELNGDNDFAVRFNKLDTGLASYNIDIIAELVKIQTAIVALGGAYTPGLISVDISESKVDNVKLS